MNFFTSLFKRDSTSRLGRKPLLLFIRGTEDCENCAVCQMHRLLAPLENHADILCIEDDASKSKIEIYFANRNRILIFAHFHPSTKNIFLLDNGSNDTNWVKLHKKSNDPLTFGHICYGAVFYRSTPISNWVSFLEELTITFGICWVEERMKNLYQKIIQTLAHVNTSKDLQVELERIYREELEHLGQHPDEIGSEILIANLTPFYKSLISHTQ